MNWLKIALLIIGLLRDLNKSNSKEEFQALRGNAFGDGTLLNWFWENREQIIAFLVMILGRGQTPADPSAPQAIESEDSPSFASVQSELDALKSEIA